MSKVQTLRVFVNQRLSAAAEEIFELFERTIAEYEEQLCRQNKLLDAVYKPEVRLHRADVQHLLVIKEEVQRDSSLDQEDPPQLSHIKEEQEDLWTNQEAADTTEFTFVPVKREEEDEEKPQSSQLHPSSQTGEMRHAESFETEAKGEDCGRPRPAKDINPDVYFSTSEPEIDDNGFGLEAEDDASELDTDSNTFEQESNKNAFPHETDDSSDWGETREPQAEQQDLSCSVCTKNFQQRHHLVKHMRVHTGEKPFCCSACGRRFSQEPHLKRHMIVHSGEKPFPCSVCGARFTQRSSLTSHLRGHTGEKPHTCPVCQSSFTLRKNLYTHMRIHSEEKPFSCSVCGQVFTERGHLKAHLTRHAGEKMFTCSVCSKKFARQGTLKRHLTTHTGEKPYSCSVCKKGFTRHHYVKLHKCVGERNLND